MKWLAVVFAVGVAFAAQAQEKVVLGMSGWTGFQPLKLAELAGIFKKNGVDMEIRFIAPVQRSAALASGALNAAATTVDQHIVWSSAGIPSVQVALIDKSNGGDGLVVRNKINSIKELKGKEVNVDGPGTVQHFMLSYILEKNGMSIQDVIRVTLGAQPAAQAFVAGQGDAAITYEPYLSTVRAAPDRGKIIATTLDYPMVMDTFGCTPKFLTDNPAAAKALADSYFEAIALIEKDQAKSYEIMGADVKQSGEQFGNSAKYLRWQDKAANQKFFVGDFLAFNKEAADLLLEIGIIKSIPKIDDLVDTSFIK